MENCRSTIVPTRKRLQLFFRTVTSVHQLSLYGAVAETCEEYGSYPDRTGRPVVGGQSSSSLVPSVIKTEVLLNCDDLAKIFCCKDTENVKTTPQMTRLRDAKVCNNLATDELTITEYSLTTSTKVNYKIQKERNLYLVVRLRGETEHDTNDNVTTKTQNTFNTAHMNTDT